LKRLLALNVRQYALVILALALWIYMFNGPTGGLSQNRGRGRPVAQVAGSD